jgi:predicted Zn-dependent protease
VLSHEIAHAIQKHTYRQMQHRKRKRAALAIASPVAAGMGYSLVSNMLDLINGAITNGYGGTLENQADRVGLEYMIEAGGDPKESPRVWKLVTKKHGDWPTNVFRSTHDSNMEQHGFQILTIKNGFNNLDFSKLKMNELEYKRYASCGGVEP